MMLIITSVGSLLMYTQNSYIMAMQAQPVLLLHEPFCLLHAPAGDGGKYPCHVHRWEGVGLFATC